MRSTQVTWILALVSLIGSPVVSSARVSGQQCGHCHTMHNSQGGEGVVKKMIDGVMETEGNETPNQSLLVSNCVGCHAGTNDGTGDTPYVLDTSAEPQYGAGGNTLAGGNFYWVMSDDDTGHNVLDIAAEDVRHGSIPPGFNQSFNPGGNYDTDSRLTCSGTNGCHGKLTSADQYADLSRAHHGNDDVIDGQSIAGSFRFLMGVQGLEDSDWEYQPTSTEHNQYKGEDRSDDGSRSTVVVDSKSYPVTISGLCGNCHANFHSNASGIDEDGNMSSPWLRHPTDFDLGSTAGGSEYRSYNGAGDSSSAPYSLQSPVASSNVSVVLSTVDVSSATGEALVNCLSCHRAHGSPYDAILRWDFKSWPGGGYNGCAVCHTSKD
ncbi:MAG: hypothetical protein KQH63_17400 [Desulfobulbaceae bacterium]|nr:hypothetical protein [Desulfobulbaceae bacterium]